MTTPGQSEGDRARDEVLAGEYVLGVLSAPKRVEVEERIRRDRQFALIVRRWEQNLSSLNEEYEIVAPPSLVLPLIEARLFGEAQSRTSRPLAQQLWTSLALWRGVALASIFLLGGTLFFTSQQQEARPVAGGPSLVADLSPQPGIGTAAMTLAARYDRTSGRLSLTPVAAGAADQHSLELWMIKGNDPAVSLGILPADGQGSVTIPDKVRPQLSEGVTLAVSLEPYGGSPTGSATGPILAVGRTRAR
ncbi:anti-sigma factor [Rhizobium oryzicola]|uniref:Anti-sigma factor n=1 Tax=Rhizobium oryzicola TaxID=1232668 RepID=A0ABT8SS13_9HYPH|nr:anti-sigma factor [Rhizobium oryzicola]MDO1580849.1 anti-sigma factor [Rhizobium oryzicola]